MCNPLVSAKTNTWEPFVTSIMRSQIMAALSNILFAKSCVGRHFPQDYDNFLNAKFTNSISTHTYKYPRLITPGKKVKLLLWVFKIRRSFALHHYPYRILLTIKNQEKFLIRIFWVLGRRQNIFSPFGNITLT